MRPDRARQVLAANATNVIYERAVSTLRAKLWRAITVIWALTVLAALEGIWIGIHMMVNHR